MRKGRLKACCRTQSRQYSFQTTFFQTISNKLFFRTFFPTVEILYRAAVEKALQNRLSSHLVEYRLLFAPEYLRFGKQAFRI